VDDTVTARFRTRGQPAALAAVRRFVDGAAPHAVLLVGPGSVGKTTLARDLAMGLLCQAPDPAARPCGGCRGCRQVASGNHPDLHQLSPEGPGGQIGIGRIRELGGDLALMPVEGGARVALVEGAQRLNEDAQNAMLKLLEEPPPGVVIVLCADDEERLLDTVRSRCVRVRLGPVAIREIEGLLDELGLADPPTAARLARIAAGRPGLAVAYARAPDAVIARSEIARGLLDLLPGGRSARLSAVRDLATRAAETLGTLDRAWVDETSESERPARSSRRRSTTVKPGTPDAAPIPPEVADAEATTSTRSPASERRRAAAWLVEAWREVFRDLALVAAGTPALVRDAGLLDELEVMGGRLEPAAVTAFLDDLDRASERLDANVAPELLLDALALAAPRPGPVA
jgi:DNA polymerase-3 subunit delta'